MTLDVIACAFCGEAAEVLDRYVSQSTAGPVAHVHTRCIQRHHFNGPEEQHG